MGGSGATIASAIPIGLAFQGWSRIFVNCPAEAFDITRASDKFLAVNAVNWAFTSKPLDALSSNSILCCL